MESVPRPNFKITPWFADLLNRGAGSYEIASAFDASPSMWTRRLVLATRESKAAAITHYMNAKSKQQIERDLNIRCGDQLAQHPI
jgi:hypothetical protein